MRLADAPPAGDRHLGGDRQAGAVGLRQRGHGTMDSVDLLDTALVDAYLARLGKADPVDPDTETLFALQRRHLTAIPFENLTIHSDQKIVLSESALVEKLVRAQRGGICYELNGAFAALLTALGYRVTQLAGRVFDPTGATGPPHDHLALRVETSDEDGPWLVDVGFGQGSTRPLALSSRADQQADEGVYRLVEVDWEDLDVYRNGAPQYRLEQRPRVLADFEATCWWHQTSPTSPFARSTLCSLHTGDGGRITLSGRKLISTGADGTRTEEDLADESAVLDAYRRHFGIVLDQEPVVKR